MLAIMAKPTVRPDDPEQYARFVRLVEELGITCTPVHFERAFTKVKSAPETAPPPRPKPKKRWGLLAGLA